MSDTLLTPEELSLLRNIPEGELIELAAELDMAIPEAIVLPELLQHVVVALTQLARRDGLPFSPYDKEDLEALPSDHFRALASACGSATDLRSFLKAGQRVYKGYRKTRPKSQIPLLLPMFLPAVARHASLTE